VLAGVLSPSLAWPGCYTCYTGSAHDVAAARIAADPSWQVVHGVPFVEQRTGRDCGAAALAMVVSHLGAPMSAAEVAALVPPGDDGIAVGALRDLARRFGLEAFVISGTVEDLAEQVWLGRPVVVGLEKPLARGRSAPHYEVVVGLNREKRLVLSLDPARGLRENTVDGFLSEWTPAKKVALIVFARDPGAPDAAAHDEQAQGL
jgi:ABC-type bacteriocin/lantibiotic exporter with double-glycine peptidase domain